VLRGVKESVKGVLPNSALEEARRFKLQIEKWWLRLRPESKLTPMQMFRRDGYSDLLVLNLGLGVQSVVMDFGGYSGDYTAAVFNEYHCHIHVFEPVPQFATSLRERFSESNEVQIHGFGVAETDEVRLFGIADDATGYFSTGNSVEVPFRSVECLAGIAPVDIDVIAINIEGGEYELIPVLAKASVLKRAELIFVQFHRVGEDPDIERETCRRLLEESHEPLWNYDYIWEAWKRRQIVTAGDDH
jgi:FkbM family methyltransferase